MFMATYSDRKMFSLIYVKLTDVSNQSLGHFYFKVFFIFSKVKENFSTIFDYLERDIILNEYYVLDSVSRDFSFLIQDDMIWTEQLFWNFGNVFELQSTILKEVFKSLQVIRNISAFKRSWILVLQKHIVELHHSGIGLQPMCFQADLFLVHRT